MSTTPDLTDLLRRAREQYPNGQELAPGVSEAEAHVAAWHAIAVQGGYSDPVIEAWRLSCDRGRTDRHVLADRAWLDSQQGPRQWDRELVGALLKPSELAAGLAQGLARMENHHPVAELQASEAATNDRGEYTGTDGKLYHLAHTDPVSLGRHVHEGPWLDCHGCNPPVVVTEPAVETRLGMLRMEYDDAKSRAAAAEERLKAVKGKLQTALSEATNGAYRSELRVPGFKPMTLVYTEPWTVDSKRLKAEQPAVYVEYAKRGSRWTLAESRSKA